MSSVTSPAADPVAVLVADPEAAHVVVRMAVPVAV